VLLQFFDSNSKRILKVGEYLVEL